MHSAEFNLPPDMSDITKNDVVLLTPEVHHEAMIAATVALRELVDAKDVQLETAAAEARMTAKKIEQLEIENGIDTKTGVLTSIAFQKEAMARITSDKRKSTPDTHKFMYFLDLDNFKQTNEILGHDGADKHVLIPTAEALKRTMRDGDLVGRFGGEEFIVLAENLTDEQAKQLAERYRSTINTSYLPNPVAGKDYASVSIGYARINTGDSYSSVLTAADVAMYAAKETPGKNAIVNYADLPQDSDA